MIPGWAKSQDLQRTNSTSQEKDPLEIIKAPLFQKLLKRNPDLPVLSGMKLEVVNPLNRSQMCLGTILSVSQDLLYVQLDIPGDLTKFWFDLMDCEVFPLGWSRATGHMILTPMVSASLLASQYESALSPLPPTCIPRINGREKISIYLNNKCYTGPFLSKSKLAALPKIIGPGPVRLVLMDVVKRIANLAYVQMRILRELDAPNTKPPEGRIREELKVKFKKRVYKGVIEVATRLDTVQDYCTEICKKLQVCPNLISLSPCLECPLNCSERNKVKSIKDKKTNSNKSIDYKSFLFKPLINPQSFVNRSPFQKDVVPPEETSPEHTMVWNKEKCLRKRKVNIYLEREKKRLKIHNETGSSNSKEKESEENSAGEETRKVQIQEKTNQEICQTENIGEVSSNDTGNALDILRRIMTITELNLPHKKANPQHWTVDDVYKCVSQIPVLCRVAPLLKAEAIDGVALALLNLHFCHYYLNLDMATSVYLCRLVELVRDRFDLYNGTRIFWEEYLNGEVNS